MEGSYGLEGYRRVYGRTLLSNLQPHGRLFTEIHMPWLTHRTAIFPAIVRTLHQQWEPGKVKKYWGNVSSGQ